MMIKSCLQRWAGNDSCGKDLRLQWRLGYMEKATVEAREKLVWLNVVTNGEEEGSMPDAYAVASSKFNLRKMNT